MTKKAEFTEACLNDNTLAELQDALNGPADQFDMQTWQLTESEWREAIQDAIREKLNAS